MSGAGAPLLTVILTAERADEAFSRCLDSLDHQAFTDWRCVCIDRGDGAAAQRAGAWDGSEKRIACIHAPGATLGAARNAGLLCASGQYVHFLEGEHSLVPGGLAALLAAAQSSRWGAAVGGTERIGTRGESLASPAGGSTRALGLEELRSGARPFAGAMMLRRATLGGRSFDAEHGDAAELDLWLRLAERGVRWEQCASTVARQRIRPPSSVVEAKAVLTRHLGAIAGSRTRMGPDGSRAEALAPMLMALLTLRLASEGGGDADAMARGLAAMRPGADLSAIVSAALGSLPDAGSAHRGGCGGILEQVGAGPALWWRRWGFCGAPPRAIGGIARDRLASIIGSVERVPARVLEACEPGRQVVLLGLGKNARKLARLLARGRAPVLGRDNGLTAPPGWAAEDGIEVRLLGAEEGYSHEAQHVMTVLDDEAYLARLPHGLRIVRWSSVVKDIEQERDQWLARWPAA